MINYILGILLLVYMVASFGSVIFSGYVIAPIEFGGYFLMLCVLVKEVI